jgi:hypothetical protein
VVLIHRSIVFDVDLPFPKISWPNSLYISQNRRFLFQIFAPSSCCSSHPVIPGFTPDTTGLLPTPLLDRRPAEQQPPRGAPSAHAPHELPCGLHCIALSARSTASPIHITVQAVATCPRRRAFRPTLLHMRPPTEIEEKKAVYAGRPTAVAVIPQITGGSAVLVQPDLPLPRYGPAQLGAAFVSKKC